MKQLRELIQTGDEWLIARVVSYAKQYGYTEFTSTLKEAWRASICGLSEPILRAIDDLNAPPELRADSDHAQDPIAAFGVKQARQHRARGVTIGLFLGLTKYYRQAYVDLIMAQHYPARRQERYRSFIERFFDLVELGFSTEWANATESEKLAELQRENLTIANEKNKYVTIFESLGDPVILLDDKARIVNLNHTAHTLFIGPKDPGAAYYRAGGQTFVDEQLSHLIPSHESSVHFETVLETLDGRREFEVRIQHLLDISEKFLGSVVILNDITEYKKAGERAEIANKAKSAFLATISHEIRTPVNGIMGLTNLLADTKLSEKQKSYLDGIKSSGVVLMSVLDDVLDYSKIEAGAPELETVDFDLREVLDQLTALVEPNAVRKGLRFEVCVGANVPGFLRGDPNKIRQILLNLANNAVKFTASGSVGISVQRSSAQIRGVDGLGFEITDTGIGLQDAGSERLFEPFVQQNAAISRQFGGTGLGLAICKKLVLAMGGTIGCRNNRAEGATFQFEIPLFESVPGALEDNRTLATWDPHPLDVLLVEDNEVNRLVAEGFLMRQGHSVTAAFSGEEALIALSKRRFDLVLMDIRMRGISGFEAVRRFRDLEGENGARIPIIMVSALTIRDEIERCFAAGADAFLGKPFSPEELQDAITACLSEVPPPPGTRRQPDADAALPIIDKNVVREHLTHLGRDRATRIVSAFTKTTPALVAALRQDLDAGSFEQLADHAHALKSAAANTGLIRVANLATLLEQAATDRDKPRSGEVLDTLEPICATSFQALDKAWIEMI